MAFLCSAKRVEQDLVVSPTLQAVEDILGERGFHVFYQVLSGAASTIGIDADPTKYHYLNQVWRDGGMMNMSQLAL